MRKMITLTFPVLSSLKNMENHIHPYQSIRKIHRPSNSTNLHLQSSNTKVHYPSSNMTPLVHNSSRKMYRPHITKTKKTDHLSNNNSSFIRETSNRLYSSNTQPPASFKNRCSRKAPAKRSAEDEKVGTSLLMKLTTLRAC